jgi:hypothetical protein
MKHNLLIAAEALASFCLTVMIICLMFMLTGCGDGYLGDHSKIKSSDVGLINVEMNLCKNYFNQDDCLKHLKTRIIHE